MAKKQKSFAEKASKHGGKDLAHVKFVKSVESDKEGYWRFNESMISMEKGASLEATLKAMDSDANLADIELTDLSADSSKPAVEEAVAEAEATEVVAEDPPADASDDSKKEEIEAVAEAEAPSEEESKVDESTEASNDAPAEELVDPKSEETPSEEKSE